MKRAALLLAAAAVAVGVGAHVQATGIEGAARAAREARTFCELASLGLEAEIIAARVEAKRDAVQAAERLFNLEEGLRDARLLAAFGYAPHGRARGLSVRVSCDGAAYLPGSTGEAAWRALRATGLCDPAAPPPSPADPPREIVLH